MVYDLQELRELYPDDYPDDYDLDKVNSNRLSKIHKHFDDLPMFMKSAIMTWRNAREFRKAVYCDDEKHNGVKMPKGAAAFRQLYLNKRNRAERRGREFTLTREEFFDLSQQPCFYCGELYGCELANDKLNGNFKYTGLDRIDSEMGYTIDNVVPCCKSCNSIKHNALPDDAIRRFEEKTGKKHHLGLDK